MSDPFEDTAVVRMHRDTAALLEFLCREGVASIDTVITDMVQHIGGPEMTAMHIFHDHHQPENDLDYTDEVSRSFQSDFADVLHQQVESSKD
ncbi:MULTISPECIES: hypothetical protein [Acidithiobacillus]|uniref:hypothetical protein n=1 Tax=Acidithiobacillus ferrivorans TaxID=160808 RepID=UPI001C06FBEB|nr:hypothetical protein [Acidithiobacillus ferrivorans]MBU2852312.1 hypothetical protein [Acidithiobacillus ferrivorans]